MSKLTDTTSVIYAAYGSNCNASQMAARCRTAKFMGTGTLANYRLRFCGHGVADVVRCEGGIVPVVLWRLAHSDVYSLDRYEGFPYVYTKEWMLVRKGKRKVTVLVYVLRPELAKKPAIPSESYYNRIYKGYEMHNLPLESLMSAYDACVVDYTCAVTRGLLSAQDTILETKKKMFLN